MFPPHQPTPNICQMLQGINERGCMIDHLWIFSSCHICVISTHLICIIIVVWFTFVARRKFFWYEITWFKDCVTCGLEHPSFRPISAVWEAKHFLVRSAPTGDWIWVNFSLFFFVLFFLYWQSSFSADNSIYGLKYTHYVRSFSFFFFYIFSVPVFDQTVVLTKYSHRGLETVGQPSC